VFEAAKVVEKQKFLQLYENNRATLPRKKTGIRRNFILWPEIVQIIKKVPKSGELVFYNSKSVLFL